MRKLFFFLVLFAISIPAFAENIYVSQSGSGDGSSCGSSRSASWFNSSGNWGGGAGQINGGDTVYLCGTITSALTMQGSGSSGNIITTDGSSATLSGGFNASTRSYFTLQNVTTSGSLSNGFFNFMDSSNATITNITIPSADAYYPMEFRRASYITVNGIRANNVRQGLIRIDATTMTPPHHVTLSNLNITTTNDYVATEQRDLIHTEGAHDIIIEGSYFNKRWSSQNNPTAHNDIWQAWGNKSNPSIPNPYNVTLRHSLLITEANYDGNYQFVIWGEGAGTFNIYGNVFVKKGSDPTGSMIVLGNFLSNSTVNIYNNTFVQKDTPTYYLLLNFNMASGGTVNFKNNVVYNPSASSGVISSTGTFDHTYNTYYGGQSNGYMGTSCGSYASTGEVCNSNPLFTNYATDDFRIGTNSPAYNSGTDLGSTFNSGLSTSSSSFPNPTLTGRPQATSWNKGAYEYTGGKVPLAPSNLGIN